MGGKGGNGTGEICPRPPPVILLTGKIPGRKDRVFRKYLLKVQQKNPKIAIKRPKDSIPPPQKDKTAKKRQLKKILFFGFSLTPLTQNWPSSLPEIWAKNMNTVCVGIMHE
jgi:hypothetical protein